MKVYAVVDRKAKSVVTVFSSQNDEAAERSFLMLLTGPQNIFTDFPEDFVLYPVAELSVDGVLLVAAHGSENLVKNGFTVNSFTVNDPVKSGSDYDKRYLSMIRSDRFNLVPRSDEGGDLNVEQHD